MPDTPQNQSGLHGRERTMRHSTRAKRIRKRIRNRDMLLVSIVVLVLVAVLAVQTRSLKAEDAQLASQEARLESQLAEEYEREEELEEESLYVQSDDYVAEAAREKLGLVDPDETIIKPSE